MERERRMWRSLCSVFAVALAAIALAGCGGSGDSASSSTFAANAGESTSSAGSSGSSALGSQLVTSADAICKRLNAELALDEPKSLSTREVARYAPQRAAEERAAVAKLSRLTPPPAGAHEWAQILSYRRTLAAELALLGRAAQTKNIKAMNTLANTKKRVHEELLAVAKHAGFKYCQQVR
jgi:hypothetical protein